ncbi:MAG: membrane dipeptidase [bacterium]
MIIDLHCDTLNKLYKGYSIDDNNLDINIDKLLNQNYLVQVFALFYNNKGYNKVYINEMIDIYYDNFSKYHIKKYNDILKNYEKKIFSSFLALEDGGYINDLSDLYYFYDKGIRLICLTWNYENNLGYPHTINKPLKKLGLKVIKEMERLKIIICVSHLSDEGFYDVYNNTTAPFVASHSNCRSIKDHSRNLTDDMIIKINERNGLIGINFYNEFVSNKDITLADDVIKHILHIKSIASIDCISLGSDYDGIDNEVEFKDDIGLFIDKLKDVLTEEEIDKILYKNAAMFFKKFI